MTGGVLTESSPLLVDGSGTTGAFLRMLGTTTGEAVVVADAPPTTMVFSVGESEMVVFALDFLVPESDGGVILNVATSTDTFLARSIRISSDTLQDVGLNSTILSTQFETAAKLIQSEAGKVGESGIASHLLR